MELNSLQNSSRPYKRRKRVGRGVGSGRGKTSTRGVKGAGARSGWKSRARYEGGQIPLYRKLPERGFSRARFRKKLHVVNFSQVNTLFSDGEVVNMESLAKHGFIKGKTFGVKLLAKGELKKKVSFQVHAMSKASEEKLKALGVEYTIVSSKTE
jgi:large subunit ribosomal protein L15